MFKEFAGVILFFIILCFLLRGMLIRNKQKMFDKTIGVLLTISIIVCMIYNVIYVFPDFKYENVYLGDAEKNLFVYKDNSQFPWTILFPILRNRIVYMDRSAKEYEKLFMTFAERYESMECTAELQDILDKQPEDFTKIGMIYIEVLDYIFYDWPYEEVPDLYVNMESLKNTRQLVAYADENHNLYMMSLEYYVSFQ